MLSPTAPRGLLGQEAPNQRHYFINVPFSTNEAHVLVRSQITRTGFPQIRWQRGAREFRLYMIARYKLARLALPGDFYR
jgi:hypothetical protein